MLNRKIYLRLDNFVNMATQVFYENLKAEYKKWVFDTPPKYITVLRFLLYHGIKVYNEHNVRYFEKIYQNSNYKNNKQIMISVTEEFLNVLNKHLQIIEGYGVHKFRTKKVLILVAINSIELNKEEFFKIRGVIKNGI